MKQKKFLLVAFVIACLAMLLPAPFSARQVSAADVAGETDMVLDSEEESIASVVPDEHLRRFFAYSVGKNVEDLTVRDLGEISVLSITKHMPESFEFLSVTDFTGLEKTNVYYLALMGLTEQQTDALMNLNFVEIGHRAKFEVIDFSANEFTNGIDFSKLAPVFSESGCHIRVTQNRINTHHRLTRENYEQVVVETKDFGLIMPDGTVFEFPTNFDTPYVVFVNNAMTFYDLHDLESNTGEGPVINYTFKEASYLEPDMMTPSNKYIYNLSDVESIDYDDLSGKIYSPNVVQNLEFGHGTSLSFSETIDFNFDNNYIYSHLHFLPDYKEGTVKVRYVDETEKEIADSQEMVGEVGTDYSTEAKEISGYELIEMPENAIGVYAEEEITVTYKYRQSVVPQETQTGNVIIKYVDESGKEIAETDEMTGEVGTDYSTKAKEISGYELVETPANTIGVYAEEEIVVTYVYGETKLSSKDEENPETSLINQTPDKNITNEKKLPKTGEGTSEVSMELLGMLLSALGIFGYMVKKFN